MVKDIATNICDFNYKHLEKMTGDDYDLAEKIFKEFVVNGSIKNIYFNEKFKDIFQELDRNDLIDVIAKNNLIISCTNKNACKYDISLDFKNNLIENKVPYDGVRKYLLKNKKILEDITSAFISQRYQDKTMYSEINELNDEIVKKYIVYLEPTGLKKKNNNIGKVVNLIINKSKFDVIKNKQYLINHKNYKLGNEISASIDRGNNSIPLRDSVVIINHPANNNFILLAIASGNSSILKELIKWFENLNQNYYYDTDYLKYFLNNKINIINSELCDSNNKRHNRLACAIICRDETIINSVGDISVLIEKDNNIKKITREDSYVQRLFDLGLIDEKQIRFHKTNGFLMEELGNLSSKDVIEKNTKMINNYYQKLLLLTQSVDRIIDIEKLKKLLAESKNPKDIVEKLIEIAKNEDVYCECKLYGCDKKIESGKDNATAIAYVKKNR